jgi:hypothetical protein
MEDPLNPRRRLRKPRIPKPPSPHRQAPHRLKVAVPHAGGKVSRPRVAPKRGLHPPAGSVGGLNPSSLSPTRTPPSPSSPSPQDRAFPPEWQALEAEPQAQPTPDPEQQWMPFMDQA